MAKEFDVKIKGLKEVNKVLETLPLKYQKRALFAMMKKAAKPIVKEAKRNIVKNGTVFLGTLKRSIGVKVTSAHKFGLTLSHLFQVFQAVTI